MIPGEPVFNDLDRASNRDGVRRYVFRNNGAGTNDRTISNCYTVKDGYVGTDKNIVAYSYLFAFLNFIGCS